MRDIWIVTRKEFREQLRRRGDVFRYAWFAVLFGGFIPLVLVINGRLVVTVASLVWMGYAGVFIASSATLGAFFGERQRGTLESLLATPLTDFAIFAGKVAFSLCVSTLSIAMAVIVQVAGVNLALQVAPHLRPGFGGASFNFPATIYFALLVTLPVTLLYVISFGTFISLRLSNIRTANLLNMLCIFPLALPLGLLLQLVPVRLGWTFLFAVTGMMVVVSLLTLWAAVRFFRRETAVLNMPG